MVVTRDEYEIDRDPARLDLEVAHRSLAGSYWADGVPRDMVARSVANSLNLGLSRRAVSLNPQDALLSPRNAPLSPRAIAARAMV